MMRLIILLTALLFTPSIATAEVEKPYVVSLKNSTTNVRAGPGTQYPILWVFKHKNWPVRVVSKYEYWYKIVDHEGEEGWVYKNLISGTHTVIVSGGEPVTMYRSTEMQKPMMRLAENVVVELGGCNEYLCEVIYDRRKGWVDKGRLLMIE